MRVVMFPGQGSQHKGMGAKLFDLYPDIVAVADRLLGYSVADQCLNDKDRQLNKTQYTQPLLFLVNYLSWREHEKQRGLSNIGDMYVGHSLGEYNALVAAGVFDFEAGLSIVKKRGELMATVNGGGMAAIVNLDADELKNILRDEGFRSIDIANYNSPLQTVVAGPEIELTALSKAIAETPASFIPLSVSAPFHSRYMQSVSENFAIFLRQFTFSPPSKPVISNVTGSCYEQHNIVELLSKQLYSPVRWALCVENLVAMQASDFCEVGPGRVLTRLVRQILANSDLRRNEMPA